jgi:hypothetical protein
MKGTVVAAMKGGRDGARGEKSQRYVPEVFLRLYLYRISSGGYMG